ncbi:MAG: acetyl-CoA carboxylase biotin carboxyl carrier protein [Elusimicrobia bacterium]|nr:acetyl-CoA carboxylase biotin carboxyl carrier protein [Elusimicrobiota bacterium]
MERYYALMRERDLSELEIREGNFYLKLSRASAPVHAAVSFPTAPVSVPAAPAVAKTPHHAVSSPLAGMFYRSPAPTSPSFVKEGDRVAFGDVLGIIEAMKVMNEIRSDCPGSFTRLWRKTENRFPPGKSCSISILSPNASP